MLACWLALGGDGQAAAHDGDLAAGGADAGGKEEGREEGLEEGQEQAGAQERALIECRVWCGAGGES